MQVKSSCLVSWVSYAALGMTTALVALTYSLPSFAVNALLYAGDSDSRINIRSAPTTNSSSPHYGLHGDSVDALYETQGSDGYLWYYVRFYQSGAEGWVRGDLIRFPSSNTNSSDVCLTLSEIKPVYCQSASEREARDNIEFRQPGR